MIQVLGRESGLTNIILNSGSSLAASLLSHHITTLTLLAVRSSVQAFDPWNSRVPTQRLQVYRPDRNMVATNNSQRYCRSRPSRINDLFIRRKKVNIKIALGDNGSKKTSLCHSNNIYASGGHPSLTRTNSIEDRPTSSAS
jgi:hypothetical protein